MEVSPDKYVVQQQVELAKVLLRQSRRMAIANITLECRFSNQSALSKHFRKPTGVTPNAYRKSLH